MELHLSDGPAATEALAAELAVGLRAGDIVSVRGELGAGKTTFVRGAARALGVTELVTSPTFTIGQRYAGRLPVSHLDLHRLGDLADEEPGMLDDYVTPEAISFVEWPEVAALELRRVALDVELRHAGGDHRRIAIERA